MRMLHARRPAHALPRAQRRAPSGLGCVHTVSPVRHISERGLGKLLSHNLQQQAAGARFELAALCCNSGDRRWKSSLRA